MGTAVTLYLYRIDIDRHTRNHHRTNHVKGNSRSLPLCLYYIFIIWADTPLAEHPIAAWVMSQMDQHVVLDQSTLSGSGGWQKDDHVSVLPIEMSNEDLMRLWDAISPSYRLSIPYLVRVVRIDHEACEDVLPVVAKRFRYGEMED